MRLETYDKPYESFELILETNHECPIDTEFTLPDYCADIQKILKCITVPEVTSAAMIGDSLSVEGVADIRVLYVDAGGENVHGFDMRKEFAFTLRVGNNAINATAQVKPCVQHMTCRAVNARRVDIHITLGFSVSVLTVRRGEIACSVANDCIETRCESVELSRAVACVKHSFLLEEDHDIQGGRQTVETILRRNVRYCIDDISVSDGRVSFSGRACIELLYNCFAGEQPPERMSFELPFSQSVDIPGAYDACAADICFAEGECSIKPREDDMGEYTIVNIYLKPTFLIKVTKPDAVEKISDAYTVKGILAAKYNDLTLEREIGSTKRQITLRQNIRIPEDDLERVIDIWCEGLSVSAFSERDNAVIRGKLNLCFIYRTTGKQISFTERLLDFTETSVVDSDYKYSVSGEVAAVRFAITDSSNLECTVEINLSERTRISYHGRVLASAELDETAETEEYMAVVYYASSGESVWDIAKKYHARSETIIRQNELEGDTLQAAQPVMICRR